MSRDGGPVFREGVESALLAEELGFDGFGVGGAARAGPFNLLRARPWCSGHVAALTPARSRLFHPRLTTLSLLDPVRAFEDYATLDHLSGRPA